MKHAVLSASGSARWMNCPGSRKAEEPFFGIQDSNVYAIEGTRAHELADLCLRGDQDAEEYVGRQIMKEFIEPEMARYVQEYLDYVRAYIGKDCELYTEARVDFSHVVPEGFGTMDSGVADYPNRILHVFDLKYGRGIQVHAIENSQGLLYASGMYREVEFLDAFDHIHIHIVQPRKITPNPWVVDIAYLKKFEEDAAEKANLAMTDNAPRVPGDKQCQWCKAKGECEALASFIEQSISAEFDDLEGNMDSEKLADFRKRMVLDNEKLILSFIKAVKESVFKHIEGGEDFPGYKIVTGRTTNKWNDEAEAFLKKKLKKKAFQDPKLINITNAKKLLPKGTDLDNYTSKPPGRPTLALDTDPRKALNPEDIESMFDDEKDPEE